MTGLNTQTCLYHAPPNTEKRHLQKPTHSPATTFSLKSLKCRWPPKLNQKSNNNNHFQAAYKVYHSTQNTPLSIRSGIIVTMEMLYCTSMRLDLSAAFDMIDHQIILDWWNNWFDLGGNAPKWEVSYLVSSLVKFRPIPSNRCLVFPRVQCWDHFGLLCILPNTATDIEHQLYADETQVYNSFNTASFRNSTQK